MFRTITIFTVACILGLLFQAVLVHGLMPSAIAPDFITILAVYIGLYHRRPLGVVGVFCLGILEDFASGQFVGPNAAGAIVVFLVTAVISEKIYAERAFALFGLVMLASVMKCLTLLGVYALYVNVDFFSSRILWTMIVEAFLSAVLAPVLVRVLEPGRQYTTGRQLKTRESIRWSH